MQNPRYGLNKLTISDKHKNMIIELASKKLSGLKIAKEIGLSQSKTWRQMEIMGLNNKKNFNKQTQEPDIFNWKYFNNTVI